MKQFLRDYPKERKEIIIRLNKVKVMRLKQVELLKEVIVKYSLDVKRISMVKENKLPIKAVLRNCD